MSWCQGHAKYVCEVQATDLTKVVMSIKVCDTEGGFATLFESDYAAFSAKMWYRVSFSAEGDYLSCSMQYDNPRDSDFGEVLLSLAGNISSLDSDYVSGYGVGEFGSYGDTQLFRDFNIKDDGAW